MSPGFLRPICVILVDVASKKSDIGYGSSKGDFRNVNAAA